MKNPEQTAVKRSSIAEFLSNREYLEEVERKRISPEIFNQKYGLYPKEEVERDVAASERLKKQHDSGGNREDKELKDLATVSEFVIFNLLNKEKIFGDDFSAVMPSYYDDQNNQTDVVVEYKRETKSGEKIANGAFVVDVTNGEEALKNKLVKLTGGQGVKKPKYYMPEGVSVVRPSKFPGLIIKLDVPDIEKIISFWGKDTESKEFKDIVKKVSEKMLEQLIRLSAHLSDYFKKINTETSAEYGYLNKILNKIKQVKKK